MKKKRALLRGWCNSFLTLSCFMFSWQCSFNMAIAINQSYSRTTMDKGQPGECYRKMLTTVSLSKKSGVEETWLTKAEALQKWGKDELKDRLQTGTIQARRKSASVLSSLLFCPHVSCHSFLRPNESSTNGKSVVWVSGLGFQGYYGKFYFGVQLWSHKRLSRHHQPSFSK